MDINNLCRLLNFMTFDSLNFIIFLLIFIALWRLLAKKDHKVLLIAVSSICYYALADHTSLVLLVGLAYSNFRLAKLIANSINSTIYFYLSLTINILVLAYFKYMSIGYFPLGLSFYIFQLMAYTIDVYRGQRFSATFKEFLAFISMFPQLIAGPICRANELLIQLQEKKFLERIHEGLLLLIVGYFQKCLLADSIGVIIDPIFAGNINRLDTLSTWLLFIGYSWQLYFDFSAYTNIARGICLIIGINLPENFNTPYFSSSLRDFWRRWHITLSRWFRDYVYITLGGSKSNKYINIFITFLLSGIWHGHSINFLLWGGYHGVVIVIENLVGLGQVKLKNRFVFFLDWVRTYFIVTLGWVFFKVTDVNQIQLILNRLIIYRYNVYEIPQQNKLIILILFCAVWDYAFSRFKIKLISRWSLLAMLLVLIIFFRSTGNNDFIYYRF
jgi:alginate O-acetyltransferase complex protein AlgI